MNPYKVFHSPCDLFRKLVRFILVRPEEPGNVGATLRALANMGMDAHLNIVGRDASFISEMTHKMAMHSRDAIDQICYFDDLGSALATGQKRTLTLGTTARVGSTKRPHPLWVNEAAKRAVDKLKKEEIGALNIVFGPEGSGLSNEEIEQCDWVATIPSVNSYRSLNLAQAVLVFAYEINLQLLETPAQFSSEKVSQKDRIISHILQLAEEVGFVLPGDPLKMRPQLESILSDLPKHIPQAKTIHGFLEQISRSLRKGTADYKGRYKQIVQGQVSKQEQKDLLNNLVK